MLSEYLQNKILLYNIHPMAEILKLEFKDFDCIPSSGVKPKFFENSTAGCYTCHKIRDNKSKRGWFVIMTDEHAGIKICKECWLKKHPSFVL